MKNYCAALLALLPALATAQAPASSYPFLVRGQLGHLNAPAKVYLVNGIALDSATLRDGRFELRGTVPMLSSADLVLERQGRLRDGFQDKMLGGQLHKVFVESPDRLRLFLEPGPIVVTTPDSLPHARLAGGPLTADYQRLQATTKPLSDQARAAHSPAERTALFEQYKLVRLAFIKANPNSWVSLETLQEQRQFGMPNYAEVAPLYAAFSPEMRDSPSGKQYGELLAGLKATAIGAAAPAFTQPTPDGRPVSLADYRGKYVLVDFWASWCSPCRAENPTILAVYNAFRGKNFTVLGISIDSDRERWLKAIAEDKLPWTQVADLRREGNEAAHTYGIQAIPQNYLIDPSGTIVARNLHGDELQATLARLIK